MREKKYAAAQGFTLLELLLYVGLSAMLLLVISVFLSVLLRSRVKNEAIARVQQEGNRALATMTQTIRNAESILSPAEGASGASLSLDVIDVADDPTVFDALSGALRISEGTTPAIPITSGYVIVSGVAFKNLSRRNTPGTVQIQFTISYANPGNQSEFEFIKNFYGSTSIRGE